MMDLLLKHTPHAVVHRLEVRRVRWPEHGRDTIWRLMLQQCYDVVDTIVTGHCPVLLKD